MPLQAAFRKTVLEQLRDQRFVVGQGRDVAAQIAGGQHAHLAAQLAGAAAVVGGGYDGRDLAGHRFQAAQHGRQACASAKGDDLQALLAARVRVDHVHHRFTSLCGERREDGAGELAQRDQNRARAYGTRDQHAHACGQELQGEYAQHRRKFARVVEQCDNLDDAKGENADPNQQ